MTKARRWDNADWPHWLDRAWQQNERTMNAVYPNPNDATKETLHIWTYEGAMTCQMGDWIIKGIQGELYPCKPYIFDATYERTAAHTGTEGQHD